MTGKKLPADFDLVLDPGYDFTNTYGLRWNAPNETAYPSTFLINREGASSILLEDRQGTHRENHGDRGD
jgi:hypothetical protein